jgi:hypothetical protein
MQGSGAPIAAWILGGAIALLAAALWVALSYLTSWISGWSALAARYRFAGSFDGEQMHWVYGLMRWYTKYGGVLVVGSNAQGIYLRTIWALKVGHPPLLIPWRDVEAEDRTRWMWDGTQFMLGRNEPVPLWVLKRVGDRLLEERPGLDERVENFYSGHEDREPEQPI